MENNSIDDLFKTGLSSLERKPSADAWRKLDQQRTKTRVLGWVWYAAAGVAVALITGYVLWQAETKELRTPIAVHAGAQRSPRLESVKAEQKKANSNVMTNRAVSANGRTEDHQQAISKSNLNQKVDENLIDERKEIDSEIAHVVSPETISATPSAATDEANEVVIPVEPSVKTQEPAPKRTIVVNVTATDTLEEPKMSRFARVFRQLKNARAGERVDWEEVGINPRHVLASLETKRKQ